MTRSLPVLAFAVAMGTWLLCSAPQGFTAERPFDPTDDPDMESAGEDLRGREAMAAPHVKQLLQQQRQFIQQNNLPFSVGFTSATERPLPKSRMAPDVKTRNLQTMQAQNEEAMRILQTAKIPSVEHLLNQRALQPIAPMLQRTPQLEIQPRSIPGEERPTGSGTQEESTTEPAAEGEVSSRAVSTPCASKSAFGYQQGTGEALSPIRNQGACGSCWAFAAAGIVEASKRIRYGGVANISEQELIDCAGGIAHGAIDGCNGFYIEPTMMHMQFDGVAKESNYTSYKAQDRGVCNNPYYRYSVSTWGWVGFGYATVAQIKNALCQYGPVATTIDATNLFQNYTGGVFQQKANSTYGPFPSINHAVIITGWDDAKGAWRVRNSWGTGWGENGKAWVKYNHNAIGWDTVWAVAKAPH